MVRRTVVFGLGLLLSCGGGEASGTEADTGSTGTATGDCVPGTESCPCIDSPDGQCVGDLVCLSEVCVKLPDADVTGDPPDPPPPDPGDGSTTDGGTDGLDTTETGGGGVDCSTTIGIRCSDPEEVCIGIECSHAWEHTWEMRVLQFQSGVCAEVFGDLDPDYLVWRDGSKITDSTESSCPGAWPGLSTTIEPFSGNLDSFHIDFWDNDLLSAPEHLCTWGWDTLGNGTYGPIPAWYLVDGGWFGDFRGDCYVEIEFALVE